MVSEASLSAEAVRRNLHTRLVGKRVLYFERVASTNDIAKQFADAGEPEGTLIIADEQTAGRGRLGRTWVAPARSSLLMSLILRPALTPRPAMRREENVRGDPDATGWGALRQLGRVTMAVALGARSAIQAETGLMAQIKWPNDLWVSGKKCGGILTEAETLGDRLEYVIVGLGVNVNFSAAAVAGIAPDATTLADQLGRPFPRIPLARAVLQQIERYYLRLVAGDNLREEWAAHLATLDRRVRVQTPDGTEEGTAEDVDDDGALLLRRADGTLTRLVAGDVTLLQHEHIQRGK